MISGMINGNMHIDKTERMEIAPVDCMYTYINQMVPKVYNNTRPMAEDMMIAIGFEPNICVKIHITKAISRNPAIYPPVGPKRVPGPPLNPENTGSPMAPRIIYIRIVTNPSLPPRITQVIYMANVCSVNGTANGIDIHEHTVISAINRALSAIERVDLVILYVLLFV